MARMTTWALAAGLLTACAMAGVSDDDPPAAEALLGGPVGTNHPGSGQWSPVGEATWATATWPLGS